MWNKCWGVILFETKSISVEAQIIEWYIRKWVGNFFFYTLQSLFKLGFALFQKFSRGYKSTRVVSWTLLYVSYRWDRPLYRYVVANLESESKPFESKEECCLYWIQQEKVLAGRRKWWSKLMGQNEISFCSATSNFGAGDHDMVFSSRKMPEAEFCGCLWNLCDERYSWMMMQHR